MATRAIRHSPPRTSPTLRHRDPTERKLVAVKHAFYNSKRWKQLRLMALARCPVCAICQRNPSTDVDHIIPREQGGADALSNLRGLCKRCHSRKTARSDGGFGRAAQTRSDHPGATQIERAREHEQRSAERSERSAATPAEALRLAQERSGDAQRSEGMPRPLSPAESPLGVPSRSAASQHGDDENHSQLGVGGSRSLSAAKRRASPCPGSFSPETGTVLWGEGSALEEADGHAR